MMSKQLLSIFTMSPLHVGAGNSVGAIDSPVMRERHTRIPIIPGSSLKGVLADLWMDENEEAETNGKKVIQRKADSDLMKLFGNDAKNSSSAGQLLIGEAKVLAFPIRSAKGAFAWITCPLALSRYARDTQRTINLSEIDFKDNMSCYCASNELTIDNSVVLEEYQFSNKGTCQAIAEELVAISDDTVWQLVTKKLVIVSDEMFSFFAENACEVVTRIRIDNKTGVVADGALFNIEEVPAETMFYTTIGAFDQKYTGAKALEFLKDKLSGENNLIQVGGDATIGLGICKTFMTELD